MTLLCGMRPPMALLAALVLAGCAAQPSAEPPIPLATANGILQPRGAIKADVPVVRVVDGDTVKVLVGGQETTVRLIGINTPETVKPDSPVECFGPEASEFAKSVLEGSRVTLELDQSQGATDKYGRTLAYVWRQLPDGTLSQFNLEAVANGFAFERQYGAVPYAWKPEFTEAARAAREDALGVWGAC